MKIALVTGSTRGIGGAIAKHLAQQKYTVVVHYNNSADAAATLLEELKVYAPESSIMQADLTNHAEVSKLFQEISKKYGKLDVLVNNVGNFGNYHALSDVTIEEFDDVLDTNLRATFLCINSSLPLLKASNGGNIINFACTTAEQNMARKYTAVYYIAKAGVITLTKSWAEELAADNIRINVISPGIVENSEIKQDTPMDRSANYKDITNVVDFLLADKSKYISGANLEVSGAWVPHH
ncbi:MAG: SDR family oxidoreductase [bacterium]|nr:SDR family oxidoreductase [bacterium]